MRAPEPPSRLARLLRVEDTRRDEPAFVDSLLSAPESLIRLRAVVTVGRIGAAVHAGKLRELASSPDTGIAASALFSLGLLKDSLSLSLAVSALRSSPPIGREGAWLLGELGERARSAIIASLSDVAIPAGTRGALLLAAARLSPVPTLAVTSFVASGDSSISWRAAYVLARGRSAGGVRALLAVSMSPHELVREQVARGIGLPVSGDSLGRESRAALALLVSDPSARVRVNALRAIATYGSAERERVLAALNDGDAGVRLTAAQQLDAVSDTGSLGIRVLRNALTRDTSLVVQRIIASHIVRRGGTVPELAAWRGSADWQRRAASAELDLRLVAGAHHASQLDHWLSDPDGRVRAATAGVLAGLSESPSSRDSTRSRLRGLLRDRDAGVRTTAMRALAHRATVADLAAALPSYKIAQVDSESDARLEFWALADSVLHAQTSPLPDSIEVQVAALTPPTDPAERSAAARLSRFAAWHDQAGVARSLEWYEARIRETERAEPPIIRIETERGVMELELFPRDAPLAVYSLVSLARRGYFDGQQFHRVVPNFVVQSGDPRGDGSGGPGYSIRDEVNRHRYGRGTLGMARAAPNTGGSQFFITHSPQPHLDGGYTVFGTLLTGGRTLDHIVQGDRIVRVTVQ